MRRHDGWKWGNKRNIGGVELAITNFLSEELQNGGCGTEVGAEFGSAEAAEINSHARLNLDNSAWPSQAFPRHPDEVFNAIGREWGLREGVEYGNPHFW
jgi:hypothetical protein